MVFAAKGQTGGERVVPNRRESGFAAGKTGLGQVTHILSLSFPTPENGEEIGSLITELQSVFSQKIPG